METVKYFTPAEAKKTLPLVKKIVKDILSTGKEIQIRAEKLNGKIQNDPLSLDLAEKIDNFLKELEEIGCIYKDWNFSNGLVDFPAMINNKEVYLCWRSDEEDIRFYHDIEAGYQGRKLIPKDYFIVEEDHRS